VYFVQFQIWVFMGRRDKKVVGVLCVFVRRFTLVYLRVPSGYQDAVQAV
jgi:hypothetical protein